MTDFQFLTFVQTNTLLRSTAALLQNHALRLGGLRYSPTVIRNLYFPFPACLSLISGEASLRDTHWRRNLRSGQVIAIPALNRFTVELPPRSIMEIMLYDECGWVEHKPYRLYSRSLAGLVFLSPCLTWTRDRFAASMSMTVADISRRLFAEGMSFREIVLSCRLARLLVDQSTEALSCGTRKSYGFGSRVLLENAVYDCFGLSLAALRSSINMASKPCQSNVGVQCR